jgi:hypothetical protein
MVAGIFKIGDSISPAEVQAIFERTIPDPKKRPKRQARILQALAYLTNTVPQRLEHEVNRHRRYAFDAGEEGFSYTVIGEKIL